MFCPVIRDIRVVAMAKSTEKSTSRSKPIGQRDAPAATLMESPAFRVRLGTARPSRNPKIKGFIGRIKALARQHGGGGANPRARAKGGVGGSAAARLPVRQYPQRVIIKTRVVKHSKYAARKGGTLGAIAQHVSYLGRGGAAEDGGRGVAFDAEEDLDGNTLKAFRQSFVNDRHHFRFIVSPEAGERLDLKAFARELVKEMQTDLGTSLQWIGMAHYDTDNPHLHLLVRGKDERGADLVINRDYLSHGMRLQAIEVATRHLGPRRAEDIERSLQRDLRADRVTGLDLGIAQQASLHPEGWVSALRKNDGSMAAERQRLNTLARLQHLESLGLAREVTPGVWQPDADMVPRLRQLGSRGDIIKRLHEAMRGRDPGIPTVIFNKDNPPPELIGRVFGRGAVDEISDDLYLLIEGRDGTAYHVSLGEYSEVAGREARIGSLVRVTVGRRGTGAADRTIARIARHDGIYDPDAHAVEVSNTTRLPPGVSVDDYIESHVKRAQALGRRSLVEPLADGRFRVPADLLERVAMPAIGRDSGKVVKVERLGPDLESQVRENGVTWLDRELERDGVPDARLRVGATAFERQLVAAFKSRTEHLRELGLADEFDGRIRPRPQFLNALYERELEDASRRLQSRYGELVRLEEGQRVMGRIDGIEELPSGPHAVLAMTDQFSLIPANPGLAKQVGRTLGLTIGRGRTRDLGEPPNLAIRVRYLDLNLTRTRGHSR